MRSSITSVLIVFYLSSPISTASAQESYYTQHITESSRKVWNAVSSAASVAWSYVTPNNASGLLSKTIRDYNQDDDKGFKFLMNAAGYSIKRVESGISVVPHLAIKYGRSRELAEHDILYAHRLLRKHRKLHRNTLSFVQRGIVGAVLELQEMKSYTLESVEIDLLPLPKVQFVSVPSDAPLGEEASRLMRAIERLNESLSQQ